MYPASFEYLVPKDLKEAIEYADRYGDEAKFLAGGQSLVPLMKLRLARPRYLIDLNRIPGLNRIREENGAILFGAMCRHIQVEESELVRNKIPLISDAVAHIGDVQVRSRGTIGGALAEADPAGDWGPVVLALDARLKCVGPKGERWIEAREFFTFSYTSALQDDEILSEIAFPIPGEKSAGVYQKLEKVAGDFAIASVAVQLSIDNDHRCRSVGVGLGGVGVTPVKAVSIENLLLGNPLTSDLIEEAGRLVSQEVSPLSDLRGSEDYKRKIVGVILKRALRSVTTKS